MKLHVWPPALRRRFLAAGTAFTAAALVIPSVAQASVTETAKNSHPATQTAAAGLSRRLDHDHLAVGGHDPPRRRDAGGARADHHDVGVARQNRRPRALSEHRHRREGRGRRQEIAASQCHVMVSEFLRMTSAPDPETHIDGCSRKTSVEIRLEQKAYWNQWLPAYPELLKFAPPLDGRTKSRPREGMNLPHLDRSSNTHGESIMIDLVHA